MQASPKIELYHVVYHEIPVPGAFPSVAYAGMTDLNSYRRTKGSVKKI